MRVLIPVATVAIVAAAATVFVVAGQGTPTQVELTASGLESANANTPPNGSDGEPTFLRSGSYLATISDVIQSHEDRTDLVEGAELSFEIQPDANSEGYLMDDHIELQGWDGRLRGGVVSEEVDPNSACTMTVEINIRGRAPDQNRFQLHVVENVFVDGEECDFSDLGPAREEENIYRLRAIAQR